MEVTATGYNQQLKRECMYKVLRDYSDLLRPALYSDDSKFVLVASMCAMIDRSREVSEEIASSTTRGDSSTTNDRRPSAELAPEWKLSELAKAFDTLENGISAPASLTERQRLRLMENFVVRSPYL